MEYIGHGHSNKWIEPIVLLSRKDSILGELLFSVVFRSLPISGRVHPDATCGPPKYLSTGDEREFVMFLTRCASIGYAKSQKEVLALVQRVLDSRKIPKSVTNGWWESFRHRHPSLTLRSPGPLSLARAKASHHPTEWSGWETWPDL